MVYNYQLKNGIRCVFNKIDGVFSVTSGILVGAGSVLETAKENGISHFIEHVNFKGTTTRSAFDISNDIDNLGAQINAFTSKEFTCYYVKSIGEHFSKAFEVLGDLFVNSVYNQDEIERERGVVIEEINMYEDTPDEVCIDGLSNAFYGDGGFGSTILGKADNINAFSRQDILDYKRKYYTTDNVVVSIAGAIDFEQAKDVCEKYLGCLPSTKKQNAPVINTQNKCGKFVCEKDIEQAHIALSIPYASLTDADSDSYSLICGALGGGMSSRLFQTVREKLGLCYSVYSYMTAFVPCGHMAVYAGVSQKKYHEAFQAILDELSKLKKYGLSEKEFLRTREQMKSSFILSQESTSSQMILFGKYLLNVGKIFDFNEKLDFINKLTFEEVNNVIFNRINIDKMATSIVGSNVKAI